LHKKILGAIRALGWKKSVIRKGLTFKDIFGFKPNEMQRNFYNSVKGPGVYILESSMGDGKTEAALYAAYKLLCEGYHHGLYDALPTRITSNRMYKRIDDFLIAAYKKGIAPKLIHGMSLVADVKSGGEFAPGGQFFNTNRKAIILPFGVGTVDQLLLSIVKSKYNFIRTFGIAGKVVIIDEVHSYDIFTGKLLDLLIKKLRRLGCTVIILSATLTQRRKAELLECNIKPTNNYPLLTAKRKKLSTKKCGTVIEKSYLVRKMTTNYPYFISTMKKKALTGHQAIWICNLVDRSVAVYMALRNDPDLKGLEIGTLHSRIPHAIKNKREEYWLKRLGKKEGNRDKGSILIGTQVLQESLDIDSDFMISDLAPSDFLLQRMGRLWRHLFKRPSDRAEFWISCPNLKKVQSAQELRERLGTDSKIYSAYVLWRSYQIFRRRGTITVPTDIRDILERTYRDYSYNDPKWLQEIWDKLQKSKEHLKDLADKTVGTHMDFFDDEKEDLYPLDVTEETLIRTRVGTIPYTTFLLVSSVEDKGDHIDIVFPDNDTVSSPKHRRDFTAIKKITEWLVRVPTTKLIKDLESPKWLQKVSYGYPIPVYTDENFSVRLCDNNHQTGYYYEEDCGMYKPIEL
jgi:CRISPR-associated endonuclease/helicase Cas3